jgi:hypothetical protein
VFQSRNFQAQAPFLWPSFFFTFPCERAPGAAAGQIVRRRVIVVEPFYPYYPWGYYPYGYSRYYGPANYSEVKIQTHRKDLAVYIDGGYAAEIRKDKKFTLRPGNHPSERVTRFGWADCLPRAGCGDHRKNDQAASFLNELALATFLTIVARN